MPGRLVSADIAKSESDRDNPRAFFFEIRPAFRFSGIASSFVPLGGRFRYNA